jgi:Trypsin-co-occurring domain 1
VRYLVELPVCTTGAPAQIVSVEIEQAAEGLVDVSRPGQAVARATRSLGEMLAGIRPVAENFLGAFDGMANAPDEIGLEYGISVSGDANLVIATTAAQANFKVTLTWRTPAGSVPDAVPSPEEPEGKS